MTIYVANTDTSLSFGSWLAATNKMARLFSQNTVTSDSTTTGSITTGNSYVNGYFGADYVYVNSGLVGGNVASNGQIYVLSNTAFRYGSANVFIVTSNSTFTNVVSNANNFLLNPSGNVDIRGAALNINAVAANITSTTTTMNTVLTMTGNATFKANSTFNILAITGNSTVTTLVANTSNTNLRGNLFLANNITVTGTANLQSSVAVTGAAVFSNTIAVTGNATFSNTISAVGIANLQANVIIGGSANIAGTLYLTGAANLQSTFKAAGAANVLSTFGMGGAANALSTFGVTGAANVMNTFGVSGPTTLLSTLALTGAATFSNTLVVAGASIFSNTISVIKSAAFSNTISVSGAASFTNTVSISGAANVLSTFGVTGSANLFSTLKVNGATTLSSVSVSDALYVSGAGEVTITPDAIYSAYGALGGAITIDPDGESYFDGSLNVLNITSRGSFIYNGTYGNSVIASANVTHSLGNSTVWWTGIYAANLNANNASLTNTLTAIGNSSFGANNLYVNTSVIVANGQVNMNASANIANILYVANATGTSMVKGNLTVEGTLNAGTLTYTGSSLSSIIPGANNTYDLGSAAYFWNDTFSVNVYSNNITTNTFVTNTANIAGTARTFNIYPSANVTYNLGNTTFWWANVYTRDVIANNITSTTSLSANAVTITGVANLTANASFSSSIQIGNNTHKFTHISSNSYTFSNSLVAANVDQFSPSLYRSAEYLVQITDSTTVPASYQTTKLLLIHDGTNPYLTEYGTIYNNGSLGAFNAGILGDVYIQFIPATANCVVKLSRTSITV